MISSRKESNVKKAVNKLLEEGLFVAGTVCHVGKAEQRKKLFDEVYNKNLYIQYYIDYCIDYWKQITKMF